MSGRFRWIIAVITVAVIVVGTAEPAAALPGQGVVSDFVGSGIDAAFGSVTNGMVSWVLGGVGTFADGAVNFLKTAARPRIDAVWFSGPDSPYAAVRELATTMLLGFALLGILSGLLRGDVAGMVRRIAGGIPAAVVAMVATTAVAAQLLNLTDAASTAVLSSAGGQSFRFLSGFGTMANTTTGGFAALCVGLFAVLGAFLMWIELLVRSALIYFLVALSPLAFAATLWPAARNVLRSLLELLLAVIFSKLAIAIALAVGAAALGGAGTAAGPDAGIGNAAAAGIGTLLAGTALLLMAAYSPFLLLRMIPLIEGAAVAQGISKGPARAVQSGVGTASSVASVSRLAGPSGAGGGTAGGGIAGGQKSPAFVRNNSSSSSSSRTAGVPSSTRATQSSRDTKAPGKPRS